jgi:hypothetical protein
VVSAGEAWCGSRSEAACGDYRQYSGKQQCQVGGSHGKIRATLMESVAANTPKVDATSSTPRRTCRRPRSPEPQESSHTTAMGCSFDIPSERVGNGLARARHYRRGLSQAW